MLIKNKMLLTLAISIIGMISMNSYATPFLHFEITNNTPGTFSLSKVGQRCVHNGKWFFEKDGGQATQDGNDILTIGSTVDVAYDADLSSPHCGDGSSFDINIIYSPGNLGPLPATAFVRDMTGTPGIPIYGHSISILSSFAHDATLSCSSSGDPNAPDLCSINY